MIALFAAIIAVSYLVDESSADNPLNDDQGSCGTNITYAYNSSTATLTMTGYGPMYDYSTSSK